MNIIKYNEDSKSKVKENQIPNEKENSDSPMKNIKKENIIKDLKLKGFNEVQIDDILETFIRNSVGTRPTLKDDKRQLNLQDTRTIDADIPSSVRFAKNQFIERKNRKIEYINKYSKFKNSFVLKTEKVEIKNKSKHNCVKVYINASSENNRGYYLKKNDKNNENKNNDKSSNLKKFKNKPHIVTQNNYSLTKKINPKKGNYLRKFTYQYENNTIKIEENKKELIDKLENEKNSYNKNKNSILYNNYNFKTIYASKKTKNSIDNVVFMESKNNSYRDLHATIIRQRNSLIEENKNNNSNSILLNTFSNNQKNSDLRIIKEEEKENIEYNKEKENNQNNNKISKNLENEKNNFETIKVNKKILEKHNSLNNLEKYNTIEIKGLNINNNIIKDSSNNRYIITKKIFSETNINNNKKERPRKNNYFMISKHKTEKEENFGIKNNTLIEIKHHEKKYNNNTISYHSNDKDKYEKGNKSKSLSKLIGIENNIKYFNYLKKSLSSYNHSYVNINLCKSKGKNTSTFYKIRGDSVKENSCTNLRNNLKNEILEENSSIKLKREITSLSKKEVEKNIINKINNNYNTYSNNKNHAITTSYNLNQKIIDTNEELNSLNNSNIYIDDNNVNNIKRNSSNRNILDNRKINIGKGRNLDNNQKTLSKNNTNSYINNNIKIDINNNSDIGRKPKNFNIKSKDNLNIYLKQIKEYKNGIYEGIMLNEKREIKGTMTYINGAKYEGQWRNDKKNGKGIFTSSHYYNCKNSIGMKYEGEFREDKFEGYGVTNYTNGDRYEGEWKNNKQYGKGVVTYFDGSKYDGEWKNGKFEGIGIFYLKNGEKYEGRFHNNKYNGYGKYYYNNGDYLEGIFKNDYPRGNCLLHKNDGSIVNVQH